MTQGTDTDRAITTMTMTEDAETMVEGIMSPDATTGMRIITETTDTGTIAITVITTTTATTIKD
jgi:hypothetical protein